MPRYLQLLRIEPGVSEYDWLVERYRELKTDTAISTETSGNTVLSNNSTSTTSLGTSDTTTYAYGETNNRTRTDNFSETKAGDGTITTRNTGTVGLSEADNIDETKTNSGSLIYRPNTLQTISTNGDTTDEYSDLTTEQTYDNLTDVRTGRDETSMSGTERTRRTDNTATITKNAPMSVINKSSLSSEVQASSGYIAYDVANEEGNGPESTNDKSGTARIGGIITSDGTGEGEEAFAVSLRKAMPRIVWNNATAIGQTGEDGSNKTTQNISNNRSVQDSNIRSGSVSEVTNGSVGHNTSATTTTSMSGYDDTTDTRATRVVADNSNTSTRTDNLTKTEERDTIDTKTNSGTQTISDAKGGRDVESRVRSGADTTSTTGGGTSVNSGNSSTSGEVKSILSGRAESIATLLNGAKSFIISTNAFEWLRGQLNPCFMGIYEWEVDE